MIPENLLNAESILFFELQKEFLKIQFQSSKFNLKDCFYHNKKQQQRF